MTPPEPAPSPPPAPQNEAETSSKDSIPLTNETPPPAEANTEIDLDALFAHDLPNEPDALDAIAPNILNDINFDENDLLLQMDFNEITNDTPPQTKEEAERERMKLLVGHFDEQQMSRYAAYRRANIRRASIKKFASQLLNQPISNSVALVLGGMSKVLIGDIIELARDLQDKEEMFERQRRGLPEPAPGTEPEPLLPVYIREAWTIYKRDTNTLPGSKTKLGSMNRMF